MRLDQIVELAIGSIWIVMEHDEMLGPRGSRDLEGELWGAVTPIRTRREFRSRVLRIVNEQVDTTAQIKNFRVGT